MNNNKLAIFKNIINNSDLSDATKLRYNTSLTYLVQNYPNLDIENTTIQELHNTFDHLDILQRKNIINAVNALYKHSGQPRYEPLQKYYHEIMNNVDQNINQPTERQKNNLITYDEAIRKLNELWLNFDGEEKKLNEYLVLAFYVAIPPVRADYGYVRLCKSNFDKDNCETMNLSYIYNNTLYLKNLKVKEIENGTIIETLPTEITRALELIPSKQNYLFKDPMTNQKFSFFANNILKKIFKKDVTITIMRHVYISHLDFNSMNKFEKKIIAYLMNHSLPRQDDYRFTTLS